MAFNPNMLERLQKKWKVSGGRFLLILLTFAMGGSLTGYLGKKVMAITDIENPVFYVPVYIVVITLIWPMMVILISIPLGQYLFFINYISKLWRKIGGSNKKKVAADKTESTSQGTKLKLFIQDVSQGNHLHIIKPAFPETKAVKINTKHLVIFASGAGSNAQKIIDHFRNSSTVRIELIACNNSGAGVLEIAQKEKIPVMLLEKDRFFKGDSYLPELMNAKTDLIVLAGFLWKVPTTLVTAFSKKIINIHPALLPKFGGKGMYGSFVHAAVVAAGERKSGITIHYVDDHYDEGDIIFQAECAVLKDDQPEDLAARIHLMEHLHYPQVIENILESNKSEDLRD